MNLEFDFLYDGKKRDIWHAIGYRTAIYQTPRGNEKKKQHRIAVWVQASTYDIAHRVAKKWLRQVYQAKLDIVYQTTWLTYARELEMAGMQIDYPSKPDNHTPN